MLNAVFVAPLVTLPAVALLVAPPLAEDREEAEARHALDRLRSEGGYANMPTAADQCEWSAAAGIGKPAAQGCTGGLAALNERSTAHKERRDERAARAPPSGCQR